MVVESGAVGVTVGVSVAVGVGVNIALGTAVGVGVKGSVVGATSAAPSLPELAVGVVSSSLHAATKKTVASAKVIIVTQPSRGLILLIIAPIIL